MENAPPHEHDPHPSRCTICLLDGRPVALWTCPATAVFAPTAETTVNPLPALGVQLAPGRVAVVGRSSGANPVPYLDPAYRPTQVVPGGALVLSGDDRDAYVSRAHFTLRGADAGAIVFVNGVPAAGGGIRPPTNETRLVSPGWRTLGPGEEVLIPDGEFIEIRLPNGCVLRLRAR